MKAVFRRRHPQTGQVLDRAMDLSRSWSYAGRSGSGCQEYCSADPKRPGTTSPAQTHQSARTVCVAPTDFSPARSGGQGHSSRSFQHARSERFSRPGRLLSRKRSGLQSMLTTATTSGQMGLETDAITAMSAGLVPTVAKGARLCIRNNVVCCISRVAGPFVATRASSVRCRRCR